MEGCGRTPIAVLLRGRSRPSRGCTRLTPETRVGLGGLRLPLVGHSWVAGPGRLCCLLAVGQKAWRCLCSTSRAGTCGGSS